MKRMYELLSGGGNLISFDLDRMYWVKSCFPDTKIQIHFGGDTGDLIVMVQDVKMAQALVADISNKKNEYHNNKEHENTIVNGEENNGNS